MKARLKSGKILSGRLAETFVKKGIAQEVDDFEEKSKVKKVRKSKK